MYEKTLSLTRLRSFKKTTIALLLQLESFTGGLFCSRRTSWKTFFAEYTQEPFFARFWRLEIFKIRKNDDELGYGNFHSLKFVPQRGSKQVPSTQFWKERSKKCFTLFGVRRSSFKNSHFEIFNFAPSSWLCASFSPTCIFPIWPLCNNLQ